MSKSIGVDVRTAQEVTENPAPGSVNIPMDQIAENFKARFPDLNESYFIFCEKGGRAENVKQFLETQGYTNVENIGSWREWNAFD
jgi:rhodanese-related sulfurtransferase